MEIKNKTLYDKELILKYNKYYLSSYIKKNFIIISIISIAFIIYMLSIKQWFYALILFGILLFYLGMTYLMQKVTTKKMLKKSPLVEEPVLQTYIFRDEDFLVSNIKSMTVSYHDIAKFKETKDFYLLFSKERKTYIIDSNGFESETERHKFIDSMHDLFDKRRH